RKHHRVLLQGAEVLVVRVGTHAHARDEDGREHEGDALQKPQERVRATKLRVAREGHLAHTGLLDRGTIVPLSNQKIVSVFEQVASFALDPRMLLGSSTWLGSVVSITAGSVGSGLSVASVVSSGVING